MEQFTGCTISSHKCKCFDKLSETEKESLESHSVLIQYRKGESICKQGTFASHIMYMEKGLAKVFLDDGKNSLVLKIVPEGQLLGLSLINGDHNTFPYSATAYIDSEVKLIEIGFLKSLLSKNSEFAREVISILSSNSVLINGRFFCLTHKQSYGRLADILLCLSERVFKSDNFHLQLSRKDLAELSGMSEETVIRMLKSFKEDGLIEINGKNFRVLDRPKLQKISETG